MQTLDPTICRKARLSRDPRFDGQFFLAVTSTGIYCRPICPARPPRESNVRYYRTAAEAAHSGFRPCLRCRPESAPDSPAWQGTPTTVQRALRLIGEGALNEHSAAQLSARLGVGERYLRKLFQQQLGVSPSVVAQTQRVHFAQKLLLETTLPVAEIAYASGFGSLRRFNAASREKFGCSPSELRRRARRSAQSAGGIVLQLSYRPPYDWEGMLDFFQRHAIAGIESVDAGCYQRNLCLDAEYGQIRVRHHPRKPLLELELNVPDPGQLMRVVAQVRRMFDLDANPADIGASLRRHPLLKTLIKASPGVRSPTHWSTFESAVRAVVGQQVSVAAARGVCAKLARACQPGNNNGPAPGLTFPEPTQLLQLPDDALPMPNSRKRTLRAVCAYFSQQAEPAKHDPRAALLELPGIGPWTVAMLGMRGLGDPDVFPGGDLGLLRAAQRAGSLENLDQRQLLSQMQSCKPWRSYAANLLWRSLSQ
ncbi:MAG: helix-turn-helix domain-containing protein [Gammaproteobacteria bacterium]|nr:helix-turn-helix domain-containing protein [Gammaproteobacteria bacterium]